VEKYKFLFGAILVLVFSGVLHSKYINLQPAPYTYRVNKVVIDAGHGGRDPGCHGGSSREKIITLALALKVGEYINEHLPDVEVVYTRKTDKFVALDERADIANKSHADLFISVHCNSVPASTSAHGTETYVMGLNTSKHNLEVAKRENSVILMEDDYLTSYDGFDPNSPESHIIFSLYQNAYLEQSIQYANLVESQFKNRAKRNSRGVKQAGFVVLYKTGMPSVLIEAGFLSNSREEKYLLSDDGQSYIASAIFRAFKQYKEEVEGKSNFENNKSKSNGTSSVSPDAIEPFDEPDKTYKDIVRKIVSGEDIVYRIELYDSSDNFDESNANYDNVEAIEVESDDSGFKSYMINEEFYEQETAKKKLAVLRKTGFTFAKIIAYKNNERLEP